MPSDFAAPDPTAGAYDPEWVAAQARQADPGLPPAEAGRLAREAWQHLRDVGIDAPEVARRLMAGPTASGATPANVVAKAAVDFCRQAGVDPRA